MTDALLTGFSNGLLDILILDYHLEGMNRLEVAQHLRQMKGGTSLPIIPATINDQAGLEDQVKDLRVRLVYKSILPEVLAA